MGILTELEEFIQKKATLYVSKSNRVPVRVKEQVITKREVLQKINELKTRVKDFD